ncbi:hypothetical protein B0H19DRAFT_1088363, partial [Mycena capillaripes]
MDWRSANKLPAAPFPIAACQPAAMVPAMGPNEPNPIKTRGLTMSTIPTTMRPRDPRVSQGCALM